MVGARPKGSCIIIGQQSLVFWEWRWLGQVLKKSLPDLGVEMVEARPKGIIIGQQSVGRELRGIRIFLKRLRYSMFNYFPTIEEWT